MMDTLVVVQFYTELTLRVFISSKNSTKAYFQAHFAEFLANN